MKNHPAIVNLLLLGVIASGVLALKIVRSFPEMPHRQNGADFAAPMLNPPVDWSNNAKTLVVFTRHGCRYCIASRPFYKGIVEIAQNPSHNVEILFVTPDDPSVAIFDLPTVSGNILVRNNSSIFKYIDGTPTLMLINSKGKLEEVWVGQLSQSQERDVIHRVFN